MAFANSFEQFVLAFVVLALANGQVSGALQSWFDNRYKQITKLEDPKREIYREFMGAGIKYFQISSSVFFVMGGLIATVISSGREIVFVFQGICMLILAIAFLKELDPVKEIEEDAEKVGYFTLLFDGVKFAFSSKLMTFMVLSSVVMTTIAIVWYSLVLFPIYFGYTGSDLGAGLLRWVIWFGGAFLAGKAGTFAKTKEEKSWLPISNLISIFIFFGLTYLVIIFIPIENKFSLSGIVPIISIFVTAGFFFTVNDLLMQKFLLEVIPDNKRNSLYSLLPTLAMILGAPLIYVMGHSIERIGFESAIAFFIILGILGVVLQYISMSDYIPKIHIDEVTLPYDAYSITNLDRFTFQIPKVWQVSSGVREIWDQLVETAMIDGTISDEEQAIIHSVMKNLQDYGEAVEKALQDKIITEDEHTEVLLLKQKLIQDAEKTILDDRIVSSDEVQLLNRLAKVINEIIIDRVINE